MNGCPALSVIIPTYNREAVIMRAVNSVQLQTLSDIEIIVCDDCSIDRTASIIEAAAATDSRIRYLRTPNNQGPGAARNFGIAHARAEFVSTLDSDDIYLDTRKLEEELRIAKSLSSSRYFAIGFSRKMILDQDLYVLRSADSPSTPIVEGDILAPLLARSIDIPRDFVFPKALLDDVGTYNVAYPLYEDWDLKIRMASRAKFYFTELDGIGYVQHANSLSKANIDEHVKWLWAIFEKNINLAEPCQIVHIRRQFRRHLSQVKNANSPNWLRRQAARTGLIHNPALRATWSIVRTVSNGYASQKAVVPKVPAKKRKHVSPVSKSSLPAVTIVTVCWNAGEHLKQTMETVFAQTYPAIEYIIIDGGSTDGSLSFVEENLDKVAYFVSEPDGGIYEAMNKAIKVATGEWIIFMNAGDYFVSPTTVSDVMDVDLTGVDLVYGDSRYIQKDRSVRIPARPIELMWQRISFTHQALFARTYLMKQYPFSEKLRVVADYEFYFKMYSMGKNFRYVPLDIAYILPGGFSAKALWLRTFERWSVVRRYRPKLKTDLFYMGLIAKEILRPKIRNTIKRLQQRVRKGLLIL